MRRAFSLVELSIVLVILGLLTGGILAGQSLIRAAQLRAVSTEFSRYKTAVNAFRDKYIATPGDFYDATKFFQRQINAAYCATNSSASVATSGGACDGDGNGRFTYFGTGGGTSAESFQFWRQMQLAGLIEGDYTGISGSGNASQMNLTGNNGANIPSSRINNAGWGSMPTANISGVPATFYTMDYGNNLILAGYVASSWVQGAVLKPEEAWNIDSKLDDGKPGTGIVIAAYWNNACATSSSATDFTGSYKLSDTALQCALVFPNAF